MKRDVSKRLLWAFACAAILACGACSSEPGEEVAEDDSALGAGEALGDVAQSDLKAIQDGLDAPAAASPLVLFVDPGGKDGRDGSQDAPLATLTGVHARLEALYPAGSPLDRNVEVRIAPGTYAGEEVRWTFPSSNHSVTFMPRGFEVGMRFGDVQKLGGRPIFDGRKACAGKAPGAACKFFLVDQPKNAGPSRLRFYYLDVRRYATTGLGLHNQGEGRNLVYGCRFADIGTYPTAYRHLLHGMAAVGLSDSDHNVIRNNRFVNIRNQGTQERFLHAVYMNVGSDANRVEDNVTFRVSGDPVKVRQFSNDNIVRNNTFRCSGLKAFFLDYPEDFGPASDRQDECDSWENHFNGNVLDCGYFGESLLVSYAEPGRSCGAPASWQRVHASGNTSRCTSSCR